VSHAAAEFDGQGIAKVRGVAVTPTRPSTRSVVGAVAVFFLAYLVFLLVGRSHGAAVLKIDDLILPSQKRWLWRKAVKRWPPIS